METEINKPLPLQGPKNVRELGGYPADGGRKTKTHVFLRGDSLHDATEADQEYLYDYGVRLIVDLRSAAERKMAPDRVSHREFHYVAISMLDHIQSNIAMNEILRRTSHLSMNQIYASMVDTERAPIFRVLTDLIAAEKCALFHCTAGKDRTGVISMFLLEMVGTPRDVIVDDYAVSAAYRSSEFQKEIAMVQKLGATEVPKGAFKSNPQYMEGLLDHLDEKYGSPLQYVSDIGITDGQLHDLRAKFVEGEG